MPFCFYPRLEQSCPKPTEYDWVIDVPAPKRCAHCESCVIVDHESPSSEHLQEDVIDGQYRVVLYRHDEGGERMAALMTVAQTARRHGHRASQIFYALMTESPSTVLRQLYALTWDSASDAERLLRSTSRLNLAALRRRTDCRLEGLLKIPSPHHHSA